MNLLKLAFALTYIFILSDPMIIFDFTKDCSLADWYIMDDVVMGGRSDGNMMISDEGHGVFHGDVSLENNGGFSSVRYRPELMSVSDYKTCKLKVKGDGKSYQFRIKSDVRDRFSYIYSFDTTGEWETVEIPLHDMYPSFRGRRLDMNNYSGETLAEMAILIGNKKNESFNLVLDKITLE